MKNTPSLLFSVVTTLFVWSLDAGSEQPEKQQKKLTHLKIIRIPLENINNNRTLKKSPPLVLKDTSNREKQNNKQESKKDTL